MAKGGRAFLVITTPFTSFFSATLIAHTFSYFNYILISRFNIYNSPSIFIIKKVKESLYKQDSMIQNLDTLD